MVGIKSDRYELKLVFALHASRVATPPTQQLAAGRLKYVSSVNYREDGTFSNHLCDTPLRHEKNDILRRELTQETIENSSLDP